jgi:hypothetical protein
MTTEYPYLQQFLGAYFHQDWTLDDSSADAVIERFKRENDAEMIDGVKGELTQFLASHASDDQLSRALTALGCEYHAPGDNLSYREWLRHVRDAL